MGFRSRVLSSLLARRPVRVAMARGVVSFSFDDFPQSAWTVAGPLLAAEGVHATYYASMGLCAQPGRYGPMFIAADLLAVIAAGHEVGGHTHSHITCETTPVAAYLSDVTQNRAALQSVTGALPTHFAYPKGSMAPRHKRALGGDYQTLRGVWHGLNGGAGRRFDRSALRAVRLYEDAWSDTEFAALIDRACRERAWLIFFTHDVSEHPSPWGITPTRLSRVLAMATAADVDVLPVGAAFAHVTRGQPNVSTRHES